MLSALGQVLLQTVVVLVILERDFNFETNV